MTSITFPPLCLRANGFLIYTWFMVMQLQCHFLISLDLLSPSMILPLRYWHHHWALIFPTVGIIYPHLTWALKKKSQCTYLYVHYYKWTPLAVILRSGFVCSLTDWGVSEQLDAQGMPGVGNWRQHYVSLYSSPSAGGHTLPCQVKEKDFWFLCVNVAYVWRLNRAQKARSNRCLLQILIIMVAQ